MESATSAPRKRKVLRIFLVLVVAVVLLAGAVAFLPNFLSLFTEDIAPNDMDLRFKKVSIPNNENAYYELIKLEGIIYEPKEKSGLILNMIAGKTWDEMLAEQLITRNAEAFDYFAVAASKPKFQDPGAADPSTLSPATPPLLSLRPMARLSALRALYLAKQERDKEAMEEALNSVRIGQKVQNSQVLFATYIGAILLKETGLETVQKVITSSKLDSAELNGYSQELYQFYKNEDGAANAFKSQYHDTAWAIDQIAEGIRRGEEIPTYFGDIAEYMPDYASKIKHSFYFQPNKTKALRAEYTRAQLKTISKPCGSIKQTEVPKLAPKSLKIYITENAVGKILHDIGAPGEVGGLTGVIKHKCRDDLLVAATQTLIAIKSFKNENGNYPNSLDELVPKYLSSVPTDPFSGKPLRYSPVKKIIYSVGEDSVDSGGSTGEDWKKMPDPTFTINF